MITDIFSQEVMVRNCYLIILVPWKQVVLSFFIDPLYK